MTDIAMMLPTSDITNNSHPITRTVTVPDEEAAEKETMNQSLQPCRFSTCY